MAERCTVPPARPPTPAQKFVVARMVNDFVRAARPGVSDDALEAMLDAMNRRSRHAGLPTLCAFGDIMERGLCAEEVSRG